MKCTVYVCSMFHDPLQPDLLCEEYVLVCAMFPDPLQLNLLFEEYVLVCAMFPDPLQPNLLCDCYMGGGGHRADLLVGKTLPQFVVALYTTHNVGMTSGRMPINSHNILCY